MAAAAKFKEDSKVSFKQKVNNNGI